MRKSLHRSSGMQVTQQVRGSIHRSSIADSGRPPGSPAEGPEAPQSLVASACHRQTMHETWSLQNDWRRREPCSSDRRGPVGSRHGYSERIPTLQRGISRTALDPCCTSPPTGTALLAWPFPYCCPTCSPSSGRDRDRLAAEGHETLRK